MENIKFSVLMSVYKKEKRSNLEKAVDSLVNQTLTPNEIVIVKDGPLNSELDECLDDYSKKYNYVKIIALEKNVGLGNALNEGLKHCEYEYVARMDSDDISINDRFEKQVKFIADNPDIDVLGGNIMEFDDLTGNDISLRIVPNKQEDIVLYLKKRNPMNHVTVMFKKKSVIDVGGYLDCPYFEDYYLWARMVKNNKKLFNVNDTLVRVRAGLEMSSRRGSFNYIKCIINFEKKLLKLELISYKDYLYNLIVRSVISIMPNKLRYNIYQKKLRK